MASSWGRFEGLGARAVPYRLGLLGVGRLGMGRSVSRGRGSLGRKENLGKEDRKWRGFWIEMMRRNVLTLRAGAGCERNLEAEGLGR